MDKQHQEAEHLDQQSINTPLDTTDSSSSSVSPPPADTGSGGSGGGDPTDLESQLKNQSDNSIQAQESAQWQGLANTSIQAQENAHLNPTEGTGIPNSIQAGIEYMSDVSLRDVRVHYNAEKASLAGTAVLNEYPNLYIAPGQEGQLSAELWEVVHQLKQQQGITDTTVVKEEETAATTEGAVVTEETTTPAVGEENSTDETTTIEEAQEEISRQPVSSSSGVTGMEPNNTGTPVIQETSPVTTMDAEAPAERETVIQPVPSPLTTPEQDPDFQAVTDTVAVEGDKEQKHQSAEHETQEAEKAAIEPSNRRESLAQVNQVDKMEEQETPGFNTEAFVRAVMSRVEEIMPENEKEADEFSESGKVNQVKSAVTGTVDSAQNQSVGPLEQATTEQPNVSGIASKRVTPLPRADIGRNPRDIGADKATPKPLGEDRVEQPLKSNAQEIDNQFANNEITDEQLSNSNEPAFMSALDTKNTAQTDSEQAATTLRTDEQQTITQGQSEAGALGDEQMGAMHQERTNIMGGVHGEQQTTSSNYTAEEQKVADKINSLFTATKTKVEGRLSRLDARVKDMFDAGAKDAQRRFERHVKQRMDAYKEERYAGVSGALSWVGDAFTGLPDEVNAFFVEGKDEYVAAMERVVRRIAAHVATELTAAKQEVQAGRQEVADYVTTLPDNLRKVGQKAAADINRQFDELNSQIDAKQEELIETLANKYKESIEKVDSRIEELKAANRGLIDIALDAVDAVIGTILEIKAALTGVLNAALDAIGAILLDPIGFLGNIINGVGQGISGFMGKIQNYMTEGFVEWMTGTMSGVGLDIPEDIFSLEGIFSLTSQALGLTWDFIRDRAVNILGERPVKVIEEGFEIFQVIQTDGLAGAWSYMQEQFGDLKETIMDSMMGMIISEVVEAGVKWILGLLTPAGAFVKAAMMIVDVAKFFIQQGSQVMELVNAFIESISAIAAGNISKVAQSIEQALAVSVPVLIGFFTALLGIGDLVGKVQKIFRKITDRITATIDGFIEKAGAWFKDKKGRRQERRDARRNGEEGDNQEEDEDERNDRQKRKDMEEGLSLGAAVVNNEQLSEQEINVQLRAIKQRKKLDTLNADLTQETEQWHTFMLKARLDGVRSQEQTIRRRPTRADSEAEVNEADRALHQRIAAEVKRKLEAKGQSTEGVETFEAFYELLRAEAASLQREYQPQLREGINIAVELVNRVQADKQDGDVDVKVRIAPNTIDASYKVDWKVDSTTNLTSSEETEVRTLTGGTDIIALLQDLQVKGQNDLRISAIKEIRVMLSLPKVAIFVGGHIASSSNKVFFERTHNPATSIPKLGEIDVFADDTIIEVKSGNWSHKEQYNNESTDQFKRYRKMREGSIPIYLNGSQQQIRKTILQVEKNEIHAKLLNDLIQNDFFDEVRLGNGTIINRAALTFKKKKKVKKWAQARGNNFLVTSELEFKSIS